MRLVGLCTLAMAALSATAGAAGLEEGFRNPPAQARSQAWWHWMNGNVTREGITADLEAMAEAGLGGALVFNLAGPHHKCDIPAGPADYLGPVWLDLAKHSAEEAERLGLEFGMHNCAGWATTGGPWIKPELAMQKLVSSEAIVEGGRRIEMRLPRPEVSLGHYRDIAVFAIPAAMDTGFRVHQWQPKAGQRGGRSGRQPDLRPLPENAAIPLEAIVDVSRHMREDGALSWNAPPGRWKILRLGHTPTGNTNKPAPASATGLEIDKLRREGMDVHWQHGIQPVLDHLGPLAGKVFKHLTIDSYEAGLHHWTPRMREEFGKRRGYDSTPYLLALTGRAIGDGPTTDRFFWDFRRTIGQEVWGTCDGTTATSNRFGKGTAFAGIPPVEALAALDVPPAVQLPPSLAWIHRRSDDADIFFVSNQSDTNIHAVAGFRVTGKRPEFWDAEKETIRAASGWTVAGAHTRVPLELAPGKSVFVVFRHPGRPGSGSAARAEVTGMPEPLELAGPWTVRFQRNRGAPAEVRFDKLLSWAEHGDAGIRYFSGTATNSIRFDLPAGFLRKDREVWLDLGEVAVIAEARLNGQDLGVLWHPPFRVEVSRFLRAGANALEVDVSNLWINRLIGDERHPDDCEWTEKALARWPDWFVKGQPRPSASRVTFTTWKHWTAADALLPSGLLGPVTLRCGGTGERRGVTVTELRCEYLADPLGIDTRLPRFSWKLLDSRRTRGQKQTAYRIVVEGDSPEGAGKRTVLWDSGKVDSSQSVNNVYAGKPLTSGRNCHWKVRVWDREGNASDWSEEGRFSVGLPDPSDWEGEWIRFKEADNIKHIWYRRNFALEDVPSLAFVYLASIGYHELYVNGRRVGTRVLSPAVSNLEKRALYVTYDIADALQKGDNVIAVWTGPGWARSDGSYGKGVWKQDSIFKCQVNMSNGIGLCSDTSWKCTVSSSENLGLWKGGGKGETTWPEYWEIVGHDSRIHTCYTGIAGYFTMRNRRHSAGSVRLRHATLRGQTEPGGRLDPCQHHEQFDVRNHGEQLVAIGNEGELSRGSSREHDGEGVHPRRQGRRRHGRRNSCG